MHSGPVSPQPAPGLTSSSQLPVSVLHYIQYILFFHLTYRQTKPGYLKSHSNCLLSVCLFVFLPVNAQGQRQENEVPGGCQRESYSGKALSHSCPVIMVWGGYGRRVYGRGCIGRAGPFKYRQNLISKAFHRTTSTWTSRSFQLNLNAKYILQMFCKVMLLRRWLAFS